MGRRIASYHEDDKEGKAWVVTDEGEIFKGDVVVGADGVRSRARKLVLGFDDKPQSSGYAVYRAWFNAEDAGIHEDPLTREFVANGDTHTGCMFPSFPFIFAFFSCCSQFPSRWDCSTEIWQHLIFRSRMQ
jgi:2-polyprenyl-6-methoxyphenol hydroxylase-like FAD-dependent oxidoreductase